MAILLRCIQNAYTDETEDLNFVMDRDYEVQGEWEDRGYLLTNEIGEEHTVGRKGEKWFDRHFIIIA
jgi:hypothetical protein